MERKVGLALAGGAAKGAYQIGVWRALEAHGIPVDCISGSSIGALNAALLCSRPGDEALAFWAGLSTARLARLRVAFPFVLLFRLLGFLGVEDLRRWQDMLYRFPAVSIGLLAVAVLFELVDTRTAFDWTLIAILAGWLALRMLPYVAHRMNLSMVSEGVLADLVRGAIDFPALHASPRAIHATVARFRPPPERDPLHDARYLPDYVDLRGLGDREIERVLVTSMSLPFGLFPEVRVAGRSYIDGWAADNVPVYPLVRAGCTEIYVVHLAPPPDDGGVPVTETRAMFHRLCELDALRKAAGREDLLEGQPWTDGRFAPQARIVHIVPSRSLGLPVIGSFLFSPARSRQLCELGYADAEAVLARQG